MSPVPTLPRETSGAVIAPIAHPGPVEPMPVPALEIVVDWQLDSTSERAR